MALSPKNVALWREHMSRSLAGIGQPVQIEAMLNAAREEGRQLERQELEQAARATAAVNISMPPDGKMGPTFGGMRLHVWQGAPEGKALIIDHGKSPVQPMNMAWQTTTAKRPPHVFAKVGERMAWLAAREAITEASDEQLFQSIVWELLPYGKGKMSFRRRGKTIDVRGADAGVMAEMKGWWDENGPAGWQLVSEEAEKSVDELLDELKAGPSLQQAIADAVGPRAVKRMADLVAEDERATCTIEQTGPREIRIYGVGEATTTRICAWKEQAGMQGWKLTFCVLPKSDKTVAMMDTFVASMGDDTNEP